jgi:glycosyltransferase involved in cell wall biosynthesis
MACSREAGEWMFGDAYLLLPNGINVSRYRYSETVRRGVREELHLEGRIVLGHVGFMNEQKNHQKLLAILEAMQPKCDQVHLLCVTGSEEVPQDLQRIIREKQLQDRITVLHRRNDVHRLLQAMDVFVFPSLWEGLSVALLEAQASGLPCIVSDGISRESDQSGHVQFVGVDEPEDIWCERILSALGGASESRAEGCDALERSSYNIDHCCRILESIYRGNENGEMRY